MLLSMTEKNLDMLYNNYTALKVQLQLIFY